MLQENFFEIDGIRTHIIEVGSGQPIVLIHGLGGPLMWQRVIEPLSQSFHVIVVDLPGWGESGCPQQLYSTDMYVDFLIKCLDVLAIQRAILMGISYGGQIAAIMSHKHPSRVGKLILITSTGFNNISAFKNDFFWKICSFVIDAVFLHNKWLICFLARRSFYDIRQRPLDLCDKFYRQLSQTGKREAWLNGLRNIYGGGDFDKTIRAISTPTLIVWGNDDRTVPRHFAEEFHKRINHSTVNILPQCAHSVPLEKPNELCEAVSTFANQEKTMNIIERK